jgi:hypothetical protein
LGEIVSKLASVSMPLARENQQVELFIGFYKVFG